MKPHLRSLTSAGLALLLAPLAAAAYAETSPNYLIANNDYSLGNSATFYTISGASLQQKAVVQTGGAGNDGIGSVATKRLTVLRNPVQACVYVADANTSDVAGIDVSTLKLTGRFPGSSTDDGSASGLGVVNNGKYLYANFTGSKTIGTFRVLPGCRLAFVGDTAAAGLNGGAIDDMAVNADLLVVTYLDGSIESFNVASGSPVSNGDLEFSTSGIHGQYPSGVDLSADGHFAIFGDGASTPTAEVSDVSSGKLTPTVVYSDLGQGQSSVSVWLSPDEKLLYMSDFSSGEVVAASFDKETGALSPGCSSPVLNGFNTKWSFTAGLTTASAVGSGSIVFVAEPDVYFGAVHVSERSGGGCTLTEAPYSPVMEKHTITLESVAAYPPRRF